MVAPAHNLSGLSAEFWQLLDGQLDMQTILNLHATCHKGRKVINPHFILAQQVSELARKANLSSSQGYCSKNSQRVYALIQKEGIQKYMQGFIQEDCTLDAAKRDLQAQYNRLQWTEKKELSPVSLKHIYGTVKAIASIKADYQLAKKVAEAASGVSLLEQHYLSNDVDTVYDHIKSNGLDNYIQKLSLELFCSRGTDYEESQNIFNKIGYQYETRWDGYSHQCQIKKLTLPSLADL
ncbi:hypothetical protein [Candidatus Protochlamydia phocaeensis]|uniref:hypothetical protein n=1 Tax=Candidatus Protochlamydia phocaeensis TaxID=1414722 RepID=UPI000839891C|nr:hypothetical protein [Candidatus Protochlamydia phocaeensis]